MWLKKMDRREHQNVTILVTWIKMSHVFVILLFFLHVVLLVVHGRDLGLFTDLGFRGVTFLHLSPFRLNPLLQLLSMLPGSFLGLFPSLLRFLPVLDGLDFGIKLVGRQALCLALEEPSTVCSRLLFLLVQSLIHFPQSQILEDHRRIPLLNDSVPHGDILASSLVVGAESDQSGVVTALGTPCTTGDRMGLLVDLILGLLSSKDPADVAPRVNVLEVVVPASSTRRRLGCSRRACLRHTSQIGWREVETGWWLDPHRICDCADRAWLRHRKLCASGCREAWLHLLCCHKVWIERYAGIQTAMNSAFDTSRIVLVSNATIAACQHDLCLAKHTTSRPCNAWVQWGGYPMRAVPIQKKHAWEAVGLFLGRRVEDLNKPFVSEVAIGPSVDGLGYAEFVAVWKLTPGKMIIGGTTILPSPRIVTSAVMFWRLAPPCLC
ncbi:hypothetical protein C8R45DRAFT_364388 [Mycena sanguinolenta]|nr:hypothetical protein C8R45DRAFT_364388 [Mycena sanguinolenta]